MASLRRIEKLQNLLREEITRLVDREIEFSEGMLVTISRVAVSRDALHANIFFTVLGGSQTDALAILEKNVYHVQQLLNRRLAMRPVPKIRFAVDEEELRREGIEKSLAELKRKKEI